MLVASEICFGPPKLKEDENESENIAPTTIESNGVATFAFGMGNEMNKSANSSSSFNFGGPKQISDATNKQSIFDNVKLTF